MKLHLLENMRVNGPDQWKMLFSAETFLTGIDNSKSQRIPILDAQVRRVIIFFLATLVEKDAILLFVFGK